MKIIILLILGAILLLIMFNFFRKRKSEPAPGPVKSLADLRVSDARVGDTVSLLAMGDDYDDLDFTVDRRNRYEAGGETWYELSGEYRGRRVFVEYWEDDVLEVSVSLDGRKLGLGDLGIREDDLIRMDESRSREETLSFDGVTWRYESSREVGYFKGGSGPGEGFYSWEFRDPEGKRLLFIEKWEDEPFEASTAQMANPADVRVFRA